MKTILKLLPILCFYFGVAQTGTDNLVRVEYNNPDLKSTDLGVGLWA